MAFNLHAAGFRLVACDASPAARGALEERIGGVAASASSPPHRRLSFAPTPAALAASPGLSAVFTSLPSVAAVRAVWLGPDGLLSGPSAPPILVDVSTSDPALARELAAAAAAAHLPPPPGGGGSDCGGGGCQPASHPIALDAPVSGGVTAAAAGTLTFLVGGPGAGLAAAAPFLAAMGRLTVHVGPQPGAGQAAKVANNLALAVQMAGLCEALALGAASSGVDPARLLAALNASSGRCWASAEYPPVPGTRSLAGAAVPATGGGYRGGFATRLMLKDLDLAARAAEGCSEGGGQGGGGVGGGMGHASPRGAAVAGAATSTLAALPMASAAHALYARLAAEQGEDVDFSGLYPFVYGGPPAAAPSGRHPSPLPPPP